ncbi:MAG: hypothetical protein L3J96_03225, partial [Thermoplasmata archaeon]|nr:hypothetical protein [Thermoplasmata archaeon]
MGKSSLLVRLAAQASRIGGVVLFDPIGDTSERLLAALPTSALDRTTWVSPSLSPTGINALRGIHGPRASGDTTTERRLGDLVYALRRVRAQHYGETPFWGPRIEETVTLALEAAAAYPGGTLVTALEILRGSDHPGRVVPESARAVSAELRQRVVDRPEEVVGARRLLAEVGRSGVLRAMLCDADARWEWGEALKRGNITVISGDASDVGEQTSRYLLAIHLALLWSAVVERRSPSKLFVFLDEAHWFAHESAAEMLRMGRRFNLHLSLATQALDSLPLAVREAALTNSGDWAVFRGSPMDAKEVSRWVPNLPLDHVLNLPRGQALVLLGKGREVFSTAVPFGHSARDTPERIARVARLSAAQYGSSRTPDGPNPPAPGPTGAPPEQSWPSTTRSGRTNRVKTTLGAGAAAAGEDETFRVHLPALRTVCDPDGTQVREVGNELRRLGGLMDSGRDSHGSFWVLRVEIVRQTA